jgi:hypothetical protein
MDDTKVFISDYLDSSNFNLDSFNCLSQMAVDFEHSILLQELAEELNS